MLTCPQRAEEHPAGLLDKPHRGEQRHHHIGRTGMDGIMGTDRAERGGILLEPGKKIEVRDGRREKIGRHDRVAQTIERKRIGDGFGQKRIGRHGRAG
jgi:hypothetical protein